MSETCKMIAQRLHLFLLCFFFLVIFVAFYYTFQNRSFLVTENRLFHAPKESERNLSPQILMYVENFYNHK